jgi:hypothetical protein
MNAILKLALMALVAAAPGAALAQKLQKQLEGSWTLVSLAALGKDGKKTEPFGPKPTGYMNFDGAGHFSILIFRPGTQKFASDNRMQGTAAENQAVVQNSTAYYGTYKANDKEGALDLRIDQATYPNWTGMAQKRTVKFVGDELRIGNPVSATGGAGAELVWKRAK